MRVHAYTHGHTRVTYIPAHTLRICIRHRYASIGHPLRRNGFGFGQRLWTGGRVGQIGPGTPAWGVTALAARV
jgi:hypothetical protein